MPHPTKILDINTDLNMETVDDYGALELIRAIRDRAIRDHIRMTADGVEWTRTMGNKRDIERYLRSKIGRYGLDMRPSELIKKLQNMTQEEALEIMKRLRCGKIGSDDEEQKEVVDIYDGVFV